VVVKPYRILLPFQTSEGFNPVTVCNKPEERSQRIQRSPNMNFSINKKIIGEKGKGLMVDCSSNAMCE